MKFCALHFEAVGPMVIQPLTFEGQTKVRLPFPSWQMMKLICSPAVALESVELVTLPVSVILCVLPSFASNVPNADPF